MQDQSSRGPRPFLRIRSRAPVLIAIGATLLALTLAIGQTIVSQREARAVGRASSDALLTLHEVLEATLDAETGQRGYLLTRKDAYLQPYADARRRLDISLGRLRIALRANPTPGDDRSMARLAGLIGHKVAELDRTIALTRTGHVSEAIAVVDQDIGKRQMDAIRHEAGLLMDQKSRGRAVAIARITRLESSLIPLIAVLGAITLGLILLALATERKRAATAAEAAQADALRAANERAGLLARELNHRVKNLFSVILSIVSLSARGNAPRDVMVEDIGARIRALALAHAATQGGDGDEAIDLHSTVSATLQPYALSGTERVSIEGPHVEVPARMVTPLGLIVHELATNAAKYGGFSAEGGTVSVSWELIEDAAGRAAVRLRWEERGGPPPRLAEDGAGPSGFGTRMIALAVSQLDGELDRRWPATGAIAQFEFPVS
ncbi:MAG: CHASE3 domain-containing protein [Candidatus Andeanibacterium colombiense]|uniref:histidine kinase n=1 Tax=Candidatus Andeanibacterium colombiense TaxID=3121345 RepID=A0AAJ6BR92_9SPHN|nr:MAG: CHASE3 domain-containing protein [Sphingomonadaceae bacterium]